MTALLLGKWRARSICESIFANHSFWNDQDRAKNISPWPSDSAFVW
jgi:hypothetical protein